VDTNHLQPFFLSKFESVRLQLLVPIAHSNLLFRFYDNVWNYWTKFTVTWKTNGDNSTISYYFNGTLISRGISSGTYMDWTDDGFLVLGGYALAPSSLQNRDHFVGWIDGLAFYNHAMSEETVTQNWMNAPNISDPSLVLYYNFDEGPNSDIIYNHGIAGSVGNLYNGRVADGVYYSDLQLGEIRHSKPAKSVPIYNISRLNYDL
jgi:hypothetical protein